MKTYIAAALAALCLGACTTETKYGPCIGAFDEKDKDLRYHADGWNVVLGIIFMETIVVPVYIVCENIQCPVGKK